MTFDITTLDLKPRSTPRRICFYGGPGSGKSTLTGYAFSYLKRRGIECDIAREFVKRWAYKKIPVNQWDQIHFFGQQFHEESWALDNGIQTMVCESPLILSAFYTKQLLNPRVDEYIDGVLRLIREFDKVYPPLHIFVKRGNKTYTEKGRFQTKEQATALDDQIYQFLIENARVADDVVAVEYEDLAGLICVLNYTFGLDPLDIPVETPKSWVDLI